MRVKNLLPRFSAGALEAGCDEAGRGCLAGPVVAAAVILPDHFYHPLLNDSKQLSEEQRNILRPVIEKEALAWSVSFNSVEMIDKVNILNASFQAMHESIARLGMTPELLLIDGNRFPAYWGVPHQCIIKGDGKYMSIAAASILAKTHRDEYMCSLAPSFPAYRWEENKGYGTLFHRKAITQFGRTVHHRKSFQIKVIDF